MNHFLSVPGYLAVTVTFRAFFNIFTFVCFVLENEKGFVKSLFLFFRSWISTYSYTNNATLVLLLPFHPRTTNLGFSCKWRKALHANASSLLAMIGVVTEMVRTALFVNNTGTIVSVTKPDAHKNVKSFRQHLFITENMKVHPIHIVTKQHAVLPSSSMVFTFFPTRRWEALFIPTLNFLLIWASPKYAWIAATPAIPQSLLLCLMNRKQRWVSSDVELVFYTHLKTVYTVISYCPLSISRTSRTTTSFMSYLLLKLFTILMLNSPTV